MLVADDSADRTTRRVDAHLAALTLVPLVAVGLTLLAMHLVGTTGVDTAAHAYKTALVRQGASAVWDDLWYGGSYGMVTYGPVYYLLAAVVGRAPLVLLAAGLLPVLFHLYVRRAWGMASASPAWALALVVVIYLANGQEPFLLALALAMGGQALEARGRPLWAALPVGVALFTNPLALVVGGVFAVADALGHPAARRRLAVFAVALVPFAVLWLGVQLAFRTPGWYLAQPWQLLKWTGVALVGVAFAALSDDPDRRGRVWLFAVAGLACLSGLALPGGVGNNAARFFAVFAVPALFMVRRARLPRAALAALVAAVAALQLATPFSYLVRTGDFAQTQPAFFAAAVQIARRTRDPAYRVHVVSLQKHWDAYYFPLDGLSLARGWFRQDDRLHNTTLYDAPTPAEYVAWLRDAGVRDVYVPQAALDPATVDERSLIERSGAFDVLQRDPRWTVYRLREAAPLVVPATTPGSGPLTPATVGAVVTSMTHDTVTIAVRRAGDYLVKVTWSPYWRLTQGDGRSGRGRGDWTRLRARAPGRFVLTLRPSLGDVLSQLF